jgi:anti-sigma factor ChrR (cupin superfamily)
MMKEISINPERTEWEEFVGYPHGTRICVLRTDENGMVRTFLLRAGRDFTVGSHTNTTSEQQLVLEGEIQSGEKSFGRGSYRFIPPGSSHDPWTSPKGALLFVTWD